MKRYTSEEFRQIAGDVATRHRMVYLFGSGAHGNNTKGSDYDFCVLTPEDHSLFKVGEFYADLRNALGTESMSYARNPSVMTQQRGTQRQGTTL